MNRTKLTDSRCGVGFTLLELLVVIAILAILAIIRSDNRGSIGTYRASPDTNLLFFFKATSVNAPSQKIVFAEKKMLYEMTRAELEEDYPYAGWSVSSSQWWWPQDKLARRHNGKSNVTFADGHVQTVRPAIGEMKEHYDPLE